MIVNAFAFPSVALIHMSRLVLTCLNSGDDCLALKYIYLSVWYILAYTSQRGNMKEPVCKNTLHAATLTELRPNLNMV